MLLRATRTPLNELLVRIFEIKYIIVGTVRHGFYMSTREIEIIKSMNNYLY